MDDAKHNDPKQTWSDVGDAFAELGRLVRERYKEAGADDTVRRAAADAQDAADEVGTSLRRSLDQFVAAAREVGDRASDLARDDDVKAKAKEAGWSLGDALSASMETIVAQLSDLFRGEKKNDGDAARDNSTTDAGATSNPSTPLPASDQKPTGGASDQ